MIKKLIKYSLPISIFIFGGLFVILFPLYKFVFDPDSIGYSAVAERVANGFFLKSVNGYWSPLSSWLVVPLIKMGIDTITGFKYLNGLTGILLLIATSKLINKFSISDLLKSIILYTCIPIFLSYCFYELCADFLLLIFFVLYLIQVCSSDFFENKKRILVSSIIAVLAYFAKSYFFPFFIVHFTLINCYYYKISLSNDRTKKFFTNICIGIISFIIMCSPWIYALSSKYHYLTFSNAGKFNSYSHLYTGPNNLPLLISPPYADSYNTWEDPWNTTIQHFSIFSSITTILKQAKLFCNNIFSFIPVFVEISFLSIAILAAIAFFSLSKKPGIKISNNIIVLTITAILMPLGYCLFSIDTRYIWIESIICLTIGAYLIQKIFYNFHLNNLQKLFLILIFSTSFLFGPILSLKSGIFSGKEEYTIAQTLKKNNISGKVICNYNSLNQYTKILLSNVIAKNQFYNYSKIDFSTKDLQAAIKEFNIDYYFFSYNTKFEKENFISGDLCKNAMQVIPDIYPGIIVLKLK